MELKTGSGEREELIIPRRCDLPSTRESRVSMAIVPDPCCVQQWLA